MSTLVGVTCSSSTRIACVSLITRDYVEFMHNLYWLACVSVITRDYVEFMHNLYWLAHRVLGTVFVACSLQLKA
jgi:hypothetical protein